MMTNAEKFEKIFNLYATEVWALPEKDFLEWLNTEIQPRQKKEDTISRQAAIDTVTDELDMIDRVPQWVCDRLEGRLRQLPSAQPKIVYCKNCIHRPFLSEDYNSESWDAGYSIIFPDYICPLQCEDGYYNKMPKDDWFCGNGDRKEE